MLCSSIFAMLCYAKRKLSSGKDEQILNTIVCNTSFHPRYVCYILQKKRLF